MRGTVKVRILDPARSWVSRSRGSLWHIGSVAFLVFVGVMVYHGALRVGFYYDDLQAIVHNPSIRSWSSFWLWISQGSAASGIDGVRVPMYRPVTLASYATDYAFWGLDPVWFHASQIVIFLGAVVLVAAIAFRLLRNRVASLVAGLIVLLHPANVEPVVYLSARSSILMGTMVLLAVYAWIRCLEASRVPRAWYAVMLGATAAALGAKESAVVVPILLWLVATCGAKLDLDWPRRTPRSLVVLLSPAVALVGMYAVARSVAAPGSSNGSPGLWDGMANFVGVAGGHLGLLLLPTGLSIVHTLSLVWSPTWIASFLAVLGVGGVAILGRRRFPFVALCLFWICTVLAPLLGLALLTNVSLLQEHRGFLAVVGFAWLVGAAASRRVDSPSRRRVVGAMVVLLLGGYGWLTWDRVAAWSDVQRFWDDTVRVAPENAMAHTSRGIAARQRGDLDAAWESFKRALDLEPEYPFALLAMADLHLDRGELTEAQAAFARLLSSHQANIEALAGLGRVAQRSGQMTSAVALYQKVLEIAPRHIEARNNLGAAFLAKQEYAAARQQFDAALAIDPDQADVLTNLGYTLLMLGEVDGAATVLGRAARLVPENPRTAWYLGIAMARKERWEDAEVALLRAQKLPGALMNLARLYESRGRTAEAANAYRRAADGFPPTSEYAAARLEAQRRAQWLEQGKSPL